MKLLLKLHNFNKNPKFAEIADVNNNKPEFRECDTYSSIAKIEEGDYKTNAPVILKVVDFLLLLAGSQNFLS